MEITHGLERLAAWVQGVESVFDVEIVPSLCCGDVYRRQEYERAAGPPKDEASRERAGLVRCGSGLTARTLWGSA